MNSEQRAAMVEEVCKLIEDTPLEPYTLEELQDGVYEYWMPWRPVANQIIDRLLATRPEPAADDREIANTVRVLVEQEASRLLADRAATVAEPDADMFAAVVFAMNKAQSEYWRNQPDLNYLGYEEAADIEAGLLPVLARAAIAAMPSGRDDNWLDDALDSVHPETYVSYVLWESGSQGSWRACIRWPDSRMSARWGYPHLDSIGHGTTRREAILDACAKAKEASGATD